MLHQAIGLSVILGFLSTEFLGLYSGGLVTAGYLAFYVDQPWRLATTVGLAIVTYLLLRLVEKFVILYGRRRFMAAVLISMLGAWAFEQGFYYLSLIPQDMRIIGYLVPGLMASDMCKQGIVKTLAMTLLIAVLVRMIMMVGVLR